MAELNPKNSTTAVGYFSSEQNAEAALRALHSAGFTRNEIDVAFHREPAISVKNPEPGFWHRTQALFGGGANPEPVRTGNAQPLSTGEVAGAETTGHSERDYGDFHRTLTGLSLPEHLSRHFSERYGRESEGVLVTVAAGSRRSEAEAILKSNGADLGEGVSSGESGKAGRPQAEAEKQRGAERMRRAG